MTSSVQIVEAHPSAPLPAGVPDLIAECAAEDFSFLTRYQAEWRDPAGPYIVPVAIQLFAMAEGRAVGMAGVIVDPYLSEAETGRLRHVYVAAGFRRQGIAEALVRRCIERARPNFRRLRLRTDNPAAAALYERHGFVFREQEPDSTHVLTFFDAD